MLTILLPLLTAPLTPLQDDFLLTEGAHVHGLCWFHMERAGEALSEELRDVGEAAWSEVAAWTGAADEPLETPFVLNLYAKRKQFASAVEGTVAGASKNTTAWGHWESRQVHLKVQPILSERTYSELGLPPLSLRKAAREVAGLALTEASGGDPSLAPARWFREGLAGWAAQRAMVSQERAVDGLGCPAWSTSFDVVQELQRGGRLPLLSEVLLDAPGELGLAERRALHEVFFTYLASDEAWLARGPRLARGWKGEALLAEVDADGLEAGFLAWLATQAPIWHEDAPALAHHLEGLQQTPVKGGSSRCWAVEPPPEGSYTVRGEYFLYRDSDAMGQVNVMLGRLEDDYLSVSFNTVVGVHAWRYSAARDADGEPPFIELTSKFMDPQLAHRRWTPFAIHYDQDQERVTVEVGEERLRPLDTTGRDMHGAWGLGTFTGSIGVWRDVECVPSER
jgi:hypothetical protein